MALQFVPSVFVDRLVSKTSKHIDGIVRTQSKSRSNRALPRLLSRRQASVDRKDIAENAEPVDATHSVQDSIPSSKETCPVADIVALRSKTVSSRYHAAERLATLGPDARHAIPELLRVLHEDDNALVRKSVALALGEIGVADNDLMQNLKRSAECDTDQFVRQRAAQALERLKSATQVSRSSHRKQIAV